MDRLGNPQYRAALAVVRRLAEQGLQAYFAGGCVRDLLLGAEPKDFDVTTAAHPFAPTGPTRMAGGRTP